MATNVVERAMGLGLNVIREVAGSPLIDRAGLRKPVETLLHEGAKHMARGMTAASKQFGGKPRAKEERLETGPGLDDFDLEPTEEQTMVLDTVRRFAAEVVRPAAEEADYHRKTPTEILTMAHELGLCSLVVPEAAGGAATAHGSVTTTLAAEALAHGDAGIAVAILAPVAVASLLADHGSAALQGRYLPAFLGEAFVPAALALAEEGVLADPTKPGTRARRDGDGYVLDGVKTLVPLGERAELFVVSATGPEGPALFVVEKASEGVSVEAEPSMGLGAAELGRLTLRGVRVAGDARVGDDPAAVLAKTVDRARVAWSAIATGTCQAVLDYVGPYTNDRMAFGEPISHKQAVAFLVANIAIETDAMRLLTYRAAARIDAGASFTREAFLARIFVADKAMEVGSAGVQLLGGHGFIRDYPVERWYRQLRGTGLVEGAVLV